jgi:hypothetical protein
MANCTELASPSGRATSETGSEKNGSRESRLRMAQRVHRAFAADPAFETALVAQGARDPVALLIETLALADDFSRSAVARKTPVNDSVRDFIARLL